MLSRRLLAVTLSLAALAAAAASPAAAGATVAGTSAWRVSGARDLGAMPARPLSITFVLAPRHAAALRSFVASSHAALTPAQFVARYAPSTRTLSAIRGWARRNRLTVRSVSANRLLVRVGGSSAQIARALRTRFDLFQSPSAGTFFGVSRAPRLPRSFAGRVNAVLGLSSLGKVSTPHPATRNGVAALPSATAISYPAAYTPQDFWSMYDAPSSQTGSGQQLAIITEGDLSQPKKDLATFEQRYGLPAVTWNQITVGTATSDTSGEDEWDLDSQYSTAFAPGVTTLDVYVGPSMANQDIATTINRWVTDDVSKQGSFSAGECESLAFASGFTSALDTILQQADAQGQTMFFSSGDTGSQCSAIVGVNGIPAGIPGVEYPASSPYGIGVGGTSVLSPSGPNEIAWYAGGGGASLFEPTPSFQASTGVGGAVPLLTRGVPDVSLDADPESGYDVIVSGTSEVIGGTSAGTPSWQGIWARAQAAHGGALGFAGPVIYSSEPAGAFHDITLGANPLPALPGWDYATGRGTPDIAKFVSGA